MFFFLLWTHNETTLNTQFFSQRLCAAFHALDSGELATTSCQERHGLHLLRPPQRAPVAQATGFDGRTGVDGGGFPQGFGVRGR